MKEQGERERIVRVATAPGMPFDYGRFEIVREPWPTASVAVSPRLGDAGGARFAPAEKYGAPPMRK